jgi:hypothetical protein
MWRSLSQAIRCKVVVAYYVGPSEMTFNLQHPFWCHGILDSHGMVEEVCLRLPILAQVHPSCRQQQEGHRDAAAASTAGTDPTSVNVPAGSNTDIGDDGCQPQAAVFGHIFEDANGNGVQDGGEPDLPGVDVVITDSLGGIQTVTTDANGDYSATVPAGSTTADVDEATLPDGYIQTAGTDPTSVNVPAGSNTDIGDDGYQRPTATPTTSPTATPTTSPTNSPTASPTASPTSSPTQSPTASRTRDATASI